MPKIYSFKAGAQLTTELLEVAKREGIKTAKIEAIGGVNALCIAYFNSKLKKYDEHEFTGFMEAVSLLGNLTLKGGEPFLHLHGTFARRDMSTIGGHVISARVFPLLEAVITPTTNTALRRFDDSMGLNSIYSFEE